MKYSIQKSEKHTILKLEEEKLDTLLAPKIKSEFVTLFQAGLTNFILDISQVKYVDSSGLSALLVANRLAKENNGLFIVVGASDHVKKLLSISKLDAVIRVLTSVEEAVDAIFLHEIEKDLNEDSDE
ncbi:MAG: STAS domain-containing protein [Cytophagales bacterium]|nr:STAS domain-containing protein [Cytophagales bacterium]MDW8384640.1 STAS domain-containing protein [Flammeovirgaceae bacterium]